MPEESASPQTEQEETRHSEVAEETAAQSEEISDDDLWDQVGKDPVEEVIDVAEEEESSIDAAAEEPDGESETFEVEALSEETTEEEEDGSKKHNYEKRYKDLEKEFHKRNEETKELRDQFQQLRLERLEMEREVERLRQERQQDTPKQQETPAKEASPLDEDWIDSDTQQTLEDFSELTAAYKKLIAQEIAKAVKSVPNNTEKITQLEEIAQEYQQRQYWQRHASELRTAIGNDFLEIDQSQEFADYVHSSPVRVRMMSESVDWNDHIAVMKDFLETPVGKARFRPDPAPTEAAEPESKPPAAAATSNKSSVRRQAAQGLLKNSSPRQERRPEDMNDDELWESIAI